MLSMRTAWGENQALSYRNMRAITGYVGLTLPVVLLLAGVVDGHIESSLSAYYYTKVGNVFTGALCVIGIFLLAYRLETVCVMAFAVSFILKGHGQPSDPGLDQTAGQPPSAAIRPPAGEDTAHARTRHQPASRPSVRHGVGRPSRHPRRRRESQPEVRT
jgi:hypothetical protein